MDEAAHRLGVEPCQVLEAVSALEEGLAGVAAGSGAPVQGGLEGGTGRIRFFTTGPFRRPPRLLAPEALALALGLRVLAGQSAGSRRAALVAMAERLEGGLATPEAAHRAAVEETRFVFDAADAGEDELRSLLLAAARDRSPCRMEYLKPGSDREEERVVEFHHLVMAEGEWYGLGWCRTVRDIRTFRVDRILRLELEPGAFEGPAEVDPTPWTRDGRVFRPREAVEVVVRYSPRIARWIAERHYGETLEDGSLRVRHTVADPHWLVGHVLQYGAEAVLEEPEELRRTVVEAATKVLGGNPSPPR